MITPRRHRAAARTGGRSKFARSPKDRARQSQSRRKQGPSPTAKLATVIDTHELRHFEISYVARKARPDRVR